MKILPETGRWQSAGLTEGSQISAVPHSETGDPSTASRSPACRGGT